jgi:hypothetical protein
MASQRKPHAPSGKPDTDDEVEFIIWARDNSFPDTYGAQSITHAKLSYQAVADLFEKKFDRNLRWQSMRKREYAHRDKYYAANPLYPQNKPANITYAPKVKNWTKTPQPIWGFTMANGQSYCSSAAQSSSNNASQAGVHPVQRPSKQKRKSAQAETVDDQTVVEETVADDTAADETSVVGLSANVHNSDQVRKLDVHTSGGWTRSQGYRPPQASIDFGNPRNYTESLWTVPANYWHPVEITLRVSDLRSGLPLGNVTVPTENLLASSNFYKNERQYHRIQELKLETKSLEVVSRYVQCIAPSLKSELPTFDSAVLDWPEGSLPAIEWDVHALVELYELARVFKDEDVQNLVMNYWFHAFRIGFGLDKSHLVVEPDPLNDLFLSSSRDCVAWDFWCMAIHTYGLVDHIFENEQGEWCPQLVSKLRSKYYGSLTPYRFRSLCTNAEKFCYRFHVHAKAHNCSLSLPWDLDKFDEDKIAEPTPSSSRAAAATIVNARISILISSLLAARDSAPKYTVDQILDKGWVEGEGAEREERYYKVRWREPNVDQFPWVKESELRRDMPDLVNAYEEEISKGEKRSIPPASEAEKSGRKKRSSSTASREQNSSCKKR